jgi:hypothetical protein
MRRRLLWSGVVLFCLALSALALHFAVGAWAWSAVAFFGVAAALGAYFGVTACGPWTETPLLEMARPRNHRYFGGAGAIARHLAFLALWSCAIGVYTLLLVYFVRAGIVPLEKEWVEHFGGQLPNLHQPGGRLGLTIAIAFLLCRATIRVERVAAARRGEELQIDDGSYADDFGTERHSGLLKFGAVRLLIVFLAPIYKELRRKTGLMESAAHALMMRDFSYRELTRAGYVLIERYEHRALRELREQLAATQIPGQPDKELEVKAGLVASALYELDGYYGARERIRAYNAEPEAKLHTQRMLGSSPPELRQTSRSSLKAGAIELTVPCSTHGPRRARLLDYRNDARGIGLIAEHCACLESAAELEFVLNQKALRGAVCHSSRPPDGGELRIGLALSEAAAQIALAELQSARSS